MLEIVDNVGFGKENRIFFPLSLQEENNQLKGVEVKRGMAIGSVD